MVLKLEKLDDEVAVITLARPRVRNAIGSETWPLFKEMLSDLHSQPPRALVITGEGGFFCSGGDLKDTGTQNGSLLRSGTTGRLQAGQEILLALSRAPYVVVAAVEGAAIGLGWSLALACDSVVASSSAVFSAPFLHRGVIPDGGLTWRLARAAGHLRAMEILLSGRTVTATEAHRMGLVTTVTDPSQAFAYAVELGRSTSQLPTDAVRLAKGLVRSAQTMDLSQALDIELVSAALNVAGGAPAEGRLAFLEGRPPSFSG